MFLSSRLKKWVAPSLLLLAQAVLPGCAAAPGSARPDSAQAVPADGGLIRPELRENPVPFDYTWEAYDARVEGLLSVQCLITDEGRVRNCRVLKSLPHMDDMALLTLYRQRYAPATYQGKPVAVDFTFDIEFSIPAPGAGVELQFHKAAEYRGVLEELCASDDSPCGPINL